MKRQYINGPDGQLHIYQWGEDGNQPPIICLSPAPFSGKAYTTLAPLLAKQRKVISVDYPGYGNSDACDQTPMIADYARSISAVIQAVSPDNNADLVGFHSGCLVAVETSLNHGQQVRQLALVDVPFFSLEKQAELLPKMAKPVELSDELDMLASAWQFCVASKVEHIPLSRAYATFVDHISTGRNTNAAFNAAFQYPCEERFKQVSHPCDIIASKSGLYEPSCTSANIIPNASLTEHLDISVAVLEKGAPIIAETISALLK